MELAVLVVIILVVCIVVSRDKSKENVTEEDNKSIDPIARNGRLKKALIWFWSYKELRGMFAACAVIYFASIILPSKFEIRMEHKASLNHDFGGNLNSPITLQFSDRGYPITVEVRHR